MCGEAVAEGVGREGLLDAGIDARLLADPLHRIDFKVFPLSTCEQPVDRPIPCPVVAQVLEQLRGEHDIAILVALALLDSYAHAATVDVGNPETCHFRHAQAGSVGGHEKRSVFEVVNSVKEANDFAATQDDGKFFRSFGKGNHLDVPILFESDAVEEPQGADGHVEGAGAETFVVQQKELVGADLFGSEPIGRLSKVLGKGTHTHEILILRAGRKVADLHVFEHALA